MSGYCTRTLEEGNACFNTKNEQGETVKPLPDFLDSLNSLRKVLTPFLRTLGSDDEHAETLKELDAALLASSSDVDAFKKTFRTESLASTHEYLKVAEPAANDGVDSAKKLRQTVDNLALLAETSHNLAKQTDFLHKLATRLIETCEKEYGAKSSDACVSFPVKETVLK